MRGAPGKEAAGLKMGEGGRETQGFPESKGGSQGYGGVQPTRNEGEQGQPEWVRGGYCRGWIGGTLHKSGVQGSP